MAPVVPFLATLLAATSLVDAAATPLKHGGGHHAAPPIYPQIKAQLGNAKRSLQDLAARYYGDSRHMEKRDNTLPAGWNNYGCVVDSYGQRLLQGSSFTSQSMTPELCMTQCQRAGFTFAGTEWTDECYCGNSFIGSGGQQQAAGRCSLPCAGDASQTWGDAWMLRVYQFNGTAGCDATSAIATVAPSATSTTVSASSSTSSAVVTTSTSSIAPSTTSTSCAPSSTLPVRSNSQDASEWLVHGCAVDTSTNRILTGWSKININNLTIDMCLTQCENSGYTYGGVEYGDECYCGNSIPSQIHFDDTLCNIACKGDGTEMCGGYWAMSLFELESGAGCSATSAVGNVGIVLPTSKVASSTASPSPSASSSTTTATIAPSTTTNAASTATASPTSTPPSTSKTNQVWAHHMVGNTYPYAVSDWLLDIQAAAAIGIDGFALNMGVESWQVDRVADAYTAAQQSGLNFKLFLSLDMTSLGCWSSGDANNLVGLVARWANHPNAAIHEGRVLVSTFAGSDCNFGTGQGSMSWQGSFVNPLKAQGVNIFFVPSIFSDISTFASNTWMDGELNWNSAWPMNNAQISTATDLLYMNALGSKEYMGAVSPYFYTHFAPNSWNKNWLYRGDDWMYCTRWEQLIAMRNTVNQVEILTWNDYGESSYIGPIHGALPQNSGDWVNGLDHQGLNILTSYYAQAYKTGSYPAITQDTVIAWTRPHSYNAVATQDPVSKPTGWDWTTDYVWVVVMATQPSTVNMVSGGNTNTVQVPAGLTKLKIANSPGHVVVTISRGGSTTATADFGTFSWTTSPALYNYNYIVKASR